MQILSKKFELFLILLFSVIGFSYIFNKIIWQGGTKVWLKLESDTSCQIPKIDPFLKSTKFLIELASNLGGSPKCIGKTSRFTTDYMSSSLIRLDGTSPYWESVNCCYTVFGRSGGTSSEITNGEECYPILHDVTHIPPTHTNLDVKCTDRISNEIVYRNQLPIPKLQQEETIKSNSEENDDEKPNVIILGLDSVSHANFLRYMSKTHEFLMRNLSAIEFHGLNKIGRGTDDNLVALLTGCRLYHPKRVDPGCELIWTNFSAKGYATLHSEDHPHNAKHIYPTIRGKRHGIGTDFDNSVYMAGVHKFHGLNPENNLLDKYGCYGDQFVVDVFADGILQTVRALRGKPYFNFVWTTTVAHEVLRNAQYMDQPTFDLLVKLQNENLLNNTVVVIYSDHGLSFGEYSKTEIGTVEGLMPLLYFVFPVWFRNKYSEAVSNVELNSMRLSTPYDIYETLKDLMNLTQLTVRERSLEGQLGQSLFTPLSLNRTCEMANIPPEYCICWERITIKNPEENPEVISAAHHVLKFLNSQISFFPECEILRFSEVLMATKLKSRIEGDDSKKYEIVFKTLPNRAEFQAFVSLSAEVIEVNGEVTRVNAYKKESSCIAEWENATYVKSICYCK